ncbi:leukemia inhibitory factor receptor [Gastrophryne carolinensis]
MTCHWETPNAAGVQYRVCYRIPGEIEYCYNTNNNSLQTKLSIGTVSVKITAKNVPGTPVISFTKDLSDIPYVPPTPEILSLVGDFQSDILFMEWTINSSNFLFPVKVKWEINVLRGEDLQLVKNETFIVQWSSNKTIFHWNWTSDYPLNCAPHSVRVQCFVYEENYYGPVKPSDWSAMKTIEGPEGDLVFPLDKVVPVGSDLAVCCKSSAHKVASIQFGDSMHDTVTALGKYSGGIQLLNLNVSASSGDNIVCWGEEEEFVWGGVVFVGYPPDDPQDFSCEARDLRIINCTWKAGRETKLYGNERGTKYTLYERFSGLNRSCSTNTYDLIDYNCSYDVNKEQNLHNFLLLAVNPLGTSNTSVVFNLRERIYPSPVERILFSDHNATQVSISWILPGDYTSVILLCQTEIKKPHGETEMRNVTLDGSNGKYYKYDITNLHPFTRYSFRVRCSSQDHFWKWSDWSKEGYHNTIAAVPSKKLDIWAEPKWNPEGCVIAVYWKHLQPKDANGEVTSYRVVWKTLYGNNLESNSTHHSKDFNSTQISVPCSDYQDYEIAVTANNSVGSSPPSSITMSGLPNENHDVELEKVSGDGSGVNITWNPDLNVTCGYVVKWIPSSQLQGTNPMWKKVSSSRTSTSISLQQLQSGICYNVSLYGCNQNRYHMMKSFVAYSEELSPKAAPNFTITETTSSSILVIWEPVLEEDLRGFLQGYLVYVVKNQNDSSYAEFLDLVRHSETKLKNISDPSVRKLKIEELRSGTGYQLGLQAYTRGGKGPIKTLVVVTNDNAVGLILAILIPIVVAVVLGIVMSIVCYQKREWIKETFYPDIPNPENSKALQFQKNISEGTKTIKTLEMNPCTPNSVEVVESFYTVPKILDTELNSPVSEDGQLPEDGSEAPSDNHVVVSYCQPTAHEDTSNPMVDGSATPSQVVYIDVQSMYQPQANSEEEAESDCLDGGGYKPQMQLPINSVTMDNQAPAGDALAEFIGYRPQGHANGWAADSPGSPTSMGSENASFGSPCSTNSRHFLIPPVDNKEPLKPSHAGWSISSLFQNKQEE